MPLIDIDKHKALAIADILKYYHSQDDTDLNNVMQMARELGEVLDKTCAAELGLREAIEQELGGSWEDDTLPTEVQELITEIDELDEGCRSEIIEQLDEVVHDLQVEDASEVNNQGHQAQITAIYQRCGSAETVRILNEILGTPEAGGSSR